MNPIGSKAATFVLETEDNDGPHTFTVKAYGTLAELCVTVLHEGETALVEGDLVERVRTTFDGRTVVAQEITAKRVWHDGQLHLSAI